MSIEEHLNNRYISINPDLKWPFIGRQFDGVEWKSGKDYENIETTLQVKYKKKNYNFFTETFHKNM